MGTPEKATAAGKTPATTRRPTIGARFHGKVYSSPIPPAYAEHVADARHARTFGATGSPGTSRRSDSHPAKLATEPRSPTSHYSFRSRITHSHRTAQHKMQFSQACRACAPGGCAQAAATALIDRTTDSRVLGIAEKPLVVHFLASIPKSRSPTGPTPMTCRHHRSRSSDSAHTTTSITVSSSTSVCYPDHVCWKREACEVVRQGDAESHYLRRFQPSRLAGIRSEHKDDESRIARAG